MGGHEPYQVAFYSMSSPCLSDGHLYFGSYNGRVYCFGDGFGTAVKKSSSAAELKKLASVFAKGKIVHSSTVNN